MIAEYVEGFNRHYPQKTCKLKPKRVRGEVRFQVIIDGDAGDITLSETDVREATRAFNRGIKK